MLVKTALVFISVLTLFSQTYSHCGGCFGHLDKSSESTKTEVQVQKTCPVIGGGISKDIYVDHNGKRIYLCCEHCKTVFEKNPETYLEKLEELGEEPERLEKEEG